MAKALIFTYLSDASQDAGDKIYSLNVIERLCNHFKVDLVSFGYSCSNSTLLKTGSKKGKLGSIFSFRPNSIHTYKDPSIIPDQSLLEGYEYIFVDHFRLLWIIEYLPKHLARRVIYISHNIESKSREVGFSMEKNLLKRAAFYLDYKKTLRFELKYLSIIQRCTAISNSDKEFLKTLVENVSDLHPGYSGQRSEPREFDRLERSVGWVGSFDFFAKQLNLIEFCEALRIRRNPASFRVIVIGRMPSSFKKKIELSYPFCTVYANVPDIYPLLENLRGGIICEPVGGGFKLKALDYIFGRTPIFALEGTCEGLDLVNETSYFTANSIEKLIEKISIEIDNSDRLKAVANKAFEQCNKRFSWDAEITRFANEVKRH